MFDQAASLPPAFWLLAITATVLLGLAKAGFPGTVTNLGVPLIAIVVAPPFAAAVLLPILLAIDAIGLVVFRGRYDARSLKLLLPGALLGMALGWLLFDWVDPNWIRVLIGVEAVVFAVDRLLVARREKSGRAMPAAPLPSAPRGLWWGGLSGFTSFISHAGGPPLMHFLLPQRLDKMQLVGTTVIYFAAVNFGKLVPYAQLGLLDLSNLAVSLLLLPAVPVGYYIGYRLLRAVDMRQFNMITAWLLLATGTKLIYDGLF
jgi:uncharacterized membrane protein YfcA